MDARLKNNILINSILQGIMFSILSFSMIYSNEKIMLALFVIAFVYLLIAPLEFDIYFLTGMTIFETSFVIGDYKAFPFLALIVCFKIIVLNGSRLYTNYRSFIAIGILVFIEFINDIIYCGLNGYLFLVLTILLLFMMLYVNRIAVEFVPEDFILCFGTAFLASTYYMIVSYGGIQIFLDKMMSSSSYIFRFGAEYGSETGGAMGIPIYSNLIVAFLLISLLNNEQSRIKKIVQIIIAILAVGIGALTVSRSFYMCLLCNIIIFLLYSNRERPNRVNKMLVILSSILLSFLVIQKYPAIISRVFNNVISRVENDTHITASRGEVAIASFDYLFEHPVKLLFGGGSYGYQLLGKSTGAAFEKGCHNFYIDVLMSWGLCGFICILFIIVDFVSSIVRKKGIVYYAPLIVVTVFAFTAFRTNSFKPLLYFLVGLLAIQSTGDKCYLMEE